MAEIARSEIILTESQAFGTARLQNERCDGHERQQAAWYDEVHDVIERLAAKMESESNPGKRSLAARIDRCRLDNGKLCYTDEQVIVTHTQLIRSDIKHVVFCA